MSYPAAIHEYQQLCRLAIAALAERIAAAPDPVPGRWSTNPGHAACHRAIALALAYFDPDSPRRGQEELWVRLESALAEMLAQQTTDGLVDLRTCNFNSPPDTAFLIDELAPLYQVLQEMDLAADASLLPRRKRLLRGFKQFIIRGCTGIARGGAHTANHRWKMASALLLADRLFPHAPWRRMAEGYLREGIDIDADGEFAERSAGGYNVVCDRAMIVLGELLHRPEYIEFADRNLAHVLHLLHADGTLATSYSRRQDRNAIVGIERYFLLYWHQAMMGGNGQFLAAAELAWRRTVGATEPDAAKQADAQAFLAGNALWLRFWHSAGAKPAPAAAPLPVEYERHFPTIGVLRRRVGRQSLTLMSASGDVLAVKFGEGPEIGLRIAASFANDGQFRGGPIEIKEGRYLISSQQVCKYFGPLRGKGPAVDGPHLGSKHRRHIFIGGVLTMTLEVTAEPDLLRLRLTAQGYAQVPVEVAFIIRHAQSISASGKLAHDAASGKHFLDDGELLVQGGAPTGGRPAGQTLRIGPGAAQHDLTVLRAVEEYPTHNAYCVRLLTPTDVELTIQADRTP